MDILELLNWRYAVKKYAPSSPKIDQVKIDYILNAINLSASSTGIQPYRVVVVQERKLLKRLLAEPHSGASAILVFAVIEKLGYAELDDYMERIASVRQLPLDSLTVFREQAAAFIFNRSEEDLFNWAAKQAYIGLGTSLLAAAAQKVDSTPMEGFDHDMFDEVLRLKELGLKSVVNLVLGDKAEEDKYGAYKKVRLPLHRLVIRK
jgi:nitroreductase/dihydropteridine reductase